MKLKRFEDVDIGDLDPFNEEDWEEQEISFKEYVVIKKHWFWDDHNSDLNEPGNVLKIIDKYTDNDTVWLEEFKNGIPVIQSGLGGNIKGMSIKRFNMKLRKGYIKEIE